MKFFTKRFCNNLLMGFSFHFVIISICYGKEPLTFDFKNPNLILVPYDGVGHGHFPKARISLQPLSSDCARMGLRGKIKKIHSTGQSKNFEEILTPRIFKTEEFDESCNLTMSIHYASRNNMEDYRCFYKRTHEKSTLVACGKINAQHQMATTHRAELIYDTTGRIISKLERTGINAFAGTVDSEAGTETMTRLPPNQLTRATEYVYVSETDKRLLREFVTSYSLGKINWKAEYLFVSEANKLAVSRTDPKTKKSSQSPMFYEISKYAEIVGFADHNIFKGKHETAYEYDSHGNWIKSSTFRIDASSNGRQLQWSVERNIEHY